MSDFPDLVSLSLNALIESIEKGSDKEELGRLPKSVFQRLFHIIRRSGSLQDEVFKCMLQSNISTLGVRYTPLLSSSLEAIGDNLSQSLEQVDLTNNKGVTDSVLSALAKCTRLQTVDLSGCKKVTANGVCNMVSSLPNLRSLSLGGTKINDGCGASIAALQHLEFLDVSRANIKDPFFVSIASGCPKLKALVAKECVRVSDKGFEAILDKQGQKELYALLAPGCVKLSDELLVKVATCSNLRTLALGSSNKITDWGLSSISGMNLNFLEVTFSDSITDEGFASFIEKIGSRLTNLSVNYCRKLGGQSLTAISKFCNNLTRLYFCLPAQPISDITLTRLAENNRSLCELTLKDCDDLSDASVTVLTKNCPSLSSVNFTSAAKLTTKSISTFSRCRNLNLLMIGGGKFDVTEKDIITLANACPELSVLELAQGLTDKSVCVLAKKCKKLRYLNLEKSSVTDKGIKEAGPFLLELVDINLRGCAQISLEGLLPLLRSAKYLKDMCVTGSGVKQPEILAQRSEYGRAIIGFY